MPFWLRAGVSLAFPKPHPPLESNPRPALSLRFLSFVIGRQALVREPISANLWSVVAAPTLLHPTGRQCERFQHLATARPCCILRVGKACGREESMDMTATGSSAARCSLRVGRQPCFHDCLMCRSLRVGTCPWLLHPTGRRQGLSAVVSVAVRSCLPALDPVSADHDSSHKPLIPMLMLA